MSDTAIATIVLIASTSFQVMAAIAALRLIPLTGKRGAWLMISAAIILMAVRRAITVFRIFSGDPDIQPDLPAELIALSISMLMFAGLASIAPLFRTMRGAHQRLEESEERFRTVLDNARDALYKLNLITHEYDYISPAIESVTGYTAEEVHAMGPQGIMKRIHPEDRQDIRHHFRGMRNAPAGVASSARLLYRWRDRDGDKRWISEERTLVRDDEGQPVAMVGSSRNVTGRVHAEEEKERMRIYLQSIIDAMPSMIVGVDFAGRVTLWNRTAEQRTGFRPDEAAGQPYHDVLPMLQDHRPAIDEAIRTGKAMGEIRIVHPDADDEPTYFELTAFPVGARGRDGAVLRLDDVTTRVQLEETMVQTEKMMSVGGLAAGMAHEINNPLGGIMQACQNIQRRTSVDMPKNAEAAKAAGTSIEAVHKYLEDRGVFDFIEGVQEDGARAARIVSDMLAYSRRSESKFSPCNVEELIETTLRLAMNDYDLKKQYDFRHTEIQKEFEPDLPEIRCEQTKIEQVLLNIIKNASQAMAESEAAKEPRIVLRAASEDGFVRIEVADNGPGMDEAVRKRVFEPFFTTKEVGVGTGLGLSVSYFIVTKQHRGSMAVESEPGRGTTFIIRLPIDPKEREEGAAAAPAAQESP